MAVAVALVSAATVTVGLLRHSTATQVGSDCLLVGELIQQWQSTSEQGEALLERSFNGETETLTVTHAEEAVATAIRNRIPHIASAAIAADLALWADGIEKVARGQREARLDPNRDPNAAPPHDFLQGSLQVHRAGPQLIKACPSAWPTRSPA